MIQALQDLKTVFRLPLRALQGFAQSLRDLAFATLPARNYGTLCRRAQTLEVQLTIVRDVEPIHLVVDGTGVKLYGEGKWEVRRHGYFKRRTWRKVHPALNANTGQVRAALMTHWDVADVDVLAELLDRIPEDEQLDVIGGNGAYDSKPCHAAIATRNATPSIPPHEGAVHWPANTPGATWRTDTVDTITRVGRREWKKASDYYRRSLAENAIYCFKTLTGNRRWARRTDSQATEVAIRVGVLNHMADLTRPQSVRIA
ncbi:hypothetical protein J2785_003377 [Burkholderia ambifaria]|nr:hypothetical protein [Burkholderia ambifaria]